MRKYSDDFSQEKKPSGIIPSGHRQVIVVEMIDGVSKASGNPMFTATIEDIETKNTMQVFLVNVPKKRWMLKSLLNAVGVEGGQDGVYSWDVTDVIGKQVTAIIEHYSEPWINRDGQSVTSNKAKVTEFIAPDLTPKQELHNGKEVQWKD